MAPRKLPPTAWKPGCPSPNPGGRPKIASEFKRKAQAAVDEHVLQAWIDEVVSRGKEWMKASELLAAYGMGKPSQSVAVTGVDGDGDESPLTITVQLVRPDDGKHQG